MNRTQFKALVCLASGISTSALAASSDPQPTASPTPGASYSREIKLLGKALGVSFTTGQNASNTGITAALGAKIFGKQKSLLKANLQTNADQTEGQLQLFVNGVQVLSTQNALSSELWSKDLKLPPVNVDATVFSYGIGPAVLKVDTGYGIEGALKSVLSTDAVGSAIDAATTMSNDASLDGLKEAKLSLIKAKVDATVKATTFVEGSANLAVVRGGLRGQITAADGKIASEAELQLDKDPVKFAVDGKVSLLGGAVSAFANYWTLFRGWRTFWKGNLFSWKGLCYDFSRGIETDNEKSNACATR